jgi:hypothetical protein
MIEHFLISREDGDEVNDARNGSPSLLPDDDCMKRVKKTKVDKLSIVAHSKVQCAPFRKDFFHEVREISLMTSKDVALYRNQLELIVNVDAPNHYQYYVNNVWRTGRVGRKGVIITFISEEEER